MDTSNTQLQLAKPLSLRANFSWTFAGNMIYAACQWGMLMVLAKLGTPEMVGQFSLGLAVTAPVIMFANLQLRGVQATDARREYEFGDYLALRIVSTLLALVVITGIVLLSGYQGETALVILVIGLAKAFEAMSDVYYGLFQQRERMDRIAKSMMIKGPISLAALGVGVWLTGSVLWGAVGMAVMWGLLLVVYDLRSARIIRRGSAEPTMLTPRWQASALARLAWLALPLGIAGTLNTLNSNIPRYVVEQIAGIERLGIFSAIAYLMMATSYVINALGKVAGPRLSQYYRTGNWKAFRLFEFKLIGMGILTGSCVVIVALILGEPMLNLLYGPEYARESNVFVILAVASAIQYSYVFLGSALTAMWYFRAHTYIQVASIVLTTLLSVILVSLYGIEGAAQAMLLNSLLQGIAYVLITFRIWQTRKLGAAGDH